MRAASNPLPKRGDRFGIKFSIRRHFKVWVAVLDRFDQQTLVGFPGHDRRSEITAFRPAALRIEQESSAGFRFRGVALGTMLDQGRAYFRFEKLRCIPRIFAGNHRMRRRPRNDGGSENQETGWPG